jgi:septal ring factor EnvC (AmiA/AmiB activator)
VRAALRRWLTSGLLLALVLGFGLTWGPRVRAQGATPATPAPSGAENPAPDEDAQKKELERIRAEASEKRRHAQELHVKENKVLKELHATESRLRTTRTNIGQLNKREKALQAELADVRSDLTRSQVALSGQKGLLARRLRHLYEFGPERELEFVLSSASFAQLVTRWDYLMRVADQDRRILFGITAQKQRIEGTQKRLDATHDQVDRTLTAREIEQKRLDNLAAQKKKSVTQIQGERKDYEAAAAELERTAQRIAALLAQLEKQRRDEEEARRRAEQGQPPAPGQPAPAPLPPYEGEFAKSRGQLGWPLRGIVVGRFGNETHPKFGTVTFNNGVDIQAGMGEAVRAVAAGRVDFVSDDYGSYGQMLILNHGSGYYTLYAHLSDILVSRGASVTSGQVIAKAGDSGSLKGTVLHFEVRKGRQSLDPLDWLRP